MSAEAVGWTFRRSPYRGAAFAVHLAIADSVNDQHADRFWMRQSILAKKARCGRGTVVDAIAKMLDDGLLELVEDRHALGQANEYRFLMPAEQPEVYSTTLSAQRTRSVVVSADKGCAPTGQGGARRARKRSTTQEVTQDEPNPPSSGDDERGVEFEIVTGLWDWCKLHGKPTPTLSHAKGNPYMALVGMVRTFLDAGWSTKEIKLALLDTQAYTVNALTVSLNRAKGRGSSAPRDQSETWDRERQSGRVVPA